MSQYRNVILLALAQACFLASSMTMVTFAGLAGAITASDPSLATVPVSLSVIATALTTAPMSMLMQRRSRRFGFRFGALFGIIAGLVGAFGIYSGSFIILCVAAVLIGPFQAAAQYYRFAAAESVTPSLAPRAISLVLVGGLLAAIVAPSLQSAFNDAFPDHRYMGAYLMVALMVALTLLPTAFLRHLEVPFQAGGDDKPSDAPMRPLGAIVRQPGFIVAVMNGALGYAMMSFVMTATPLAMEICGLGDASLGVIQKHVIAMFLPSLFTGFLIQRFGLLAVLFAGHAAFAVAFMTALSGLEIWDFSVALVALGLGWNFCFVGGSTLLTRVHTPAEKGRVQGLNEFLVFSTTGLASFAAGLILHLHGWQTVNRAAFTMLVLAAGATLLWALFGRRDELAAEAN